ncbi:MAG: tRNA (adenosine(37)-N6)-threonylcarbamoyltransferase complex ATPase subunit type 1 TsaE [Peptostreptococcaceae bacterium]|nr:tRNA (adenosine(37)-N6)-threonylcarbamoyltransferase complex ATPase subunit type 1 TsaE [Peptostreptococcaceae bacterium]
MDIITNSELETIELGRKIGQLLTNGDLICLDGDLGAGKTHFTKGLAQGMGIREEITSPTFTIVQEYDGERDLYHFDVYRLFDEEELYLIGFEDYLKRKGVIIVEWSEKVRGILPKDRLEIRIEYLDGPDNRKLVFEPFGKRAEELVEKFQGW